MVGPGPSLRPAATLMVIRDRAGVEVLMGVRSSSASFAPHALVFPGGVVDEHDGAFGADPWRMAAIRETFEETGILVAADAGESPSNLSAGAAAFARSDHLVYLSTWVTPEFLPKRYDTRFFLTAGDGGEPVPDGEEFVAAGWKRPADVIDAWVAGRSVVISPTLAHLRWLANFDSVWAALAAARDGRYFELIDQERVEGVRPRGLAHP